MINALRNSYVGYRRRGGKGPVHLTIAYTATQFDFKWKAPATSELVFHWGDGTESTVSGNDAALVTTTSSYAGAGTYSFYLTGDVTDITWIDISSQLFVSGNIETWASITSLEHLHVGVTGVTGSIEGYIVLTPLTYLNITTTAITGNVALLSTLTSLTTGTFNSSDVTFDTTPAWTNNAANLQFQDCAMTSQMVNDMIESLSTCTSCTINIAGTNAHRSDASNDDLSTLLANGNTITLNDVLGAEMAAAWNTAAFWDVVDPAWTVNEGVDCDSDGNNGFLRQNGFWTTGTTYRIEYDVTRSGGKFQAPYDGSGAAPEGSSEVTEVKTYYYSPDSSTAMMIYSNGFTGTLNALSIKPVTFT